MSYRTVGHLIAYVPMLLLAAGAGACVECNCSKDWVLPAMVVVTFCWVFGITIRNINPDNLR